MSKTLILAGDVNHTAFRPRFHAQTDEVSEFTEEDSTVKEEED